MLSCQQQANHIRSMSEDDDTTSTAVAVATQNSSRCSVGSVESSASPEDREESLYDVHGVLKPVEETPELVEERKQQLAFELSRGSSSSRSDPRCATREGYEIAVGTNPEFVDRHHLCFLRAEHFDVKRAAARCLRHYQAKLEYFGPDLVGQELGLKDLSKAERQALRAGAAQLLQTRDRSGRAILVQFANITRHLPVEIVVRVEESFVNVALVVDFHSSSFFFPFCTTRRRRLLLVLSDKTLILVRSSSISGRRDSKEGGRVNILRYWRGRRADIDSV
jgi:hypothetical protein